MPRYKNSAKPAVLKTCLKCSGSGLAPCNGREHHREKARLWADSFHLSPVIFKMPDGHPSVVGIATSNVFLGGWPALRIYVGIAEDGFRLPLRGPYATWLDLGKVNGKALWYFDVKYSSRDRVTMLDYYPAGCAIEKLSRKLLS
jgi:hypothetical protein